MSKNMILMSLLITLVIGVLAFANASAQDPPPPIGAISGFVINGDSSQPLQNTVVVAFQDGNEIFRDTSEIDGYYIMPEMQLGLYDMEASHTGFITQTEHGVEVFMDQTTSVDFELHHTCVYVEGDANGNGMMNGIDVAYGVSYFKGGTPPPYSCYCDGHTWYVSGDVNGDCVYNGLDIVYIIACFKSGFPYHGCPECRGTK